VLICAYLRRLEEPTFGPLRPTIFLLANHN
jgi:hypothetical protein